MSLPAYSLGPPIASAISRNLRGTNSVGYRYQSPFLDVANTYLPPSIKELFRLARYYASSDQLIAPAVQFLATYPLTELIIDETDSMPRREGLSDRWSSIFESERGLQMMSVLEDMGTHLGTFGNYFGSLQFPFTKFLHCTTCKERKPADRCTYVWRDYKFELNCGKCGAISLAEEEDVYKQSPHIRLVTWDPDLISIDYNPLTGRATYFLRIPDEVMVGVRMGRRTVLNYTPKVFLDAVRTGQQILLNPQLFVHLRLPGSVHWSKVWGWPEIIPAMKPAFYTQILRKAQEAVALGRLIPFTVIYPTALDPNASPYVNVNLTNWQERVRSELNKHRQDPGYTAIMPLPIGSQNLWGDGRSLLLSGELEVNQRQILLSMGIPPGLLTGEISWSAASVAMRQLEQRFIRRRRMYERLLNNFIIPKISAYLSLPPVKVRLAPFKMADDLAQKSLVQALATGPEPKVSDQTLFNLHDLDLEAEDKWIEEREAKLHKRNVLRIRRASALQALTMASQQTFAGGQVPGPGGQPQMGAGGPAEPGAAPGAPAQAGPGVNGGPPPVPGDVSDQYMPAATPGPMEPEQVDQRQVERLYAEAQSIVSQLGKLPEAQAKKVLQILRTQNPELYAIVAQMAAQLAQGRVKTKDQAARERPLPEKAPPQRKSENASI